MLNCCGMLTMSLLMLSFAAGTNTPETAPASVATGFLYKTVTYGGEAYPYCVYVPPDYTPERAWPVVLFLHGSGERGSDGFLQTEVGIGTAIRRNRDLFPAIVVMPQCPAQQSWVGPMGEMALRCVEATSREYPLDPRRVYLTGLSMGGQGVWYIAASRPQNFAAIVPLCGFADLSESAAQAEQLASRLVNIPIWCFHGDSDTAVPVTKSREMVSALRRAGGQPIYTEYRGLNHNVWDRAYADSELWRWVFAQRAGATSRPAATSQPAEPRQAATTQPAEPRKPDAPKP